MKELASIDQGLGDVGNAKASVGVEGSDLVAKVEVAVKYPISKVIEPVMGVVDGFLDKIEALIPGDQKAMAESAKAEAREALVKLLSEQPA